jgi:hypothetical protein
MSRKTLILVATAVLGVALAVAPLASADRPIRVQVPAADASGQFCEDFPVLVHATRNNEFATIFSSGAVLVTGALRVEVTNLDTGETIELNIPGPGFFSPDGSTLIGTGPWLLFGPAGFLGEGSPAGVTFISGRFVLTSDQEGNVTGFAARGHIEDICAALAA